MDIPTFTKEIINQPHDEGLRMVFADYLEEREDARAELIRAQLDRERVPVWDPLRIELAWRERQAQRVADFAFFGRLPDGCPPLCSEGGFYSGVSLSISAFLKCRSSLFRTAPITSLAIEGRATRLEALARAQEWNQIRHLTFCVESSIPEYVRFFSSAHLQHLETLELRFRPRQTAVVNDLVSAALRSLRTDSLQQLIISEGDLRAPTLLDLLQDVSFPALRSLDTGETFLGDGSLAALSEQQTVSQLRSLSLTGRFSGAALAAFQQHACSQQLVKLCLNNSQLSRDAFMVERPPSLSWLRLRTSLTDEHLPAIVDGYPQLEVLELSDNKLQCAGATWLAEHPVYQQLRRLDLSCNAIRNEGAEALASAHNERTEVLLAGNDLQRDELRGLQQRYGNGFGGLRM
ncbi:MAG: TIGR02996 domain-containing protein [Planctomycetaceae bacterium]|nr:TIGR02996 domain-containing protein [Planctomycetaceae bacterium]